jgi:drug/metabolite transporter (DMT)-like permease
VKSSAVHDRRIGVVLMIASAFTWAAGTIASKRVLESTESPASVVLVVQLLASIAVLGAICLFAGGPTRSAWRSGWVGVLEPGIAYQLALAGLSLTSAASASVLGSLEPAIVPLIAWLLFRQRPRPALVVVVAGASLGSTLVSLSSSAGGRSLVGDFLIVLSVVAAAGYVVLADRHVERVRPLPAAFTQQLWALGVVVPVAAVTLAMTGGPVWSGDFTVFLLAGAAGVLNYALPFWLYLTALTKLPVTSAAAYLTLIPVFGVVLAVVVLGESVTAMQGLGAVIVIASLAIGTKIDRPDHVIGCGDQFKLADDRALVANLPRRGPRTSTNDDIQIVDSSTPHRPDWSPLGATYRRRSSAHSQLRTMSVRTGCSPPQERR